MMLDASKAFDRVEYVRLFSLLIEKGLCPLAACWLTCTQISQLQLNGVIILQNMSVFQMVSSKGVSYPLYFLQYIYG